MKTIHRGTTNGSYGNYFSVKSYTTRGCLDTGALLCRKRGQIEAGPNLVFPELRGLS